jgi:uridine kinase
MGNTSTAPGAQRIPVVGISGGSAAGKTTLVAALAAAVPDLNPVVLNQDRYFRLWERDEDRTTNHPRAVMWERLIEDVGSLAAGSQVQWPVPGARRSEPQGLGPGGLVLVEGHLIFCCDELLPLLDLKVFLDVDPHERVLRRLLRDVEGGTDLEEAVAWYRRDVSPNFPLHTEPSRARADVVIPGGTGDGAIRLLVAGLRDLAVGARADD